MNSRRDSSFLAPEMLVLACLPSKQRDRVSPLVDIMPLGTMPSKECIPHWVIGVSEFEPFERYGFNKAHATCYGLIAYRFFVYQEDIMSSAMASSAGRGRPRGCSSTRRTSWPAGSRSGPAFSDNHLRHDAGLVNAP